jgi:hypothetical protein
VSPQESNVGCIRYEEDSSVQMMMLEDQLVHLHELLLFSEKSLDRCCSQCSLHHEARDFARAVMLHF